MPSDGPPTEQSEAARDSEPMVRSWQRFGKLLRCVCRESFTDRVLMIAAALAFYGLLGLLPALAAVAAVYGWFVDQQTMENQLGALAEVLPGDISKLLGEFLTTVPAGLGLGIGLAVNLAIILWTAQRSASGLITALNIAFDVEEKRSWIRREAIALGLAIGILLLLFVSLFLVVIVPLLGAALGGPLAGFLELARWPVLALIFVLGLTLAYSVAPCRSRGHRQWLSWGAVTGTALWIAASALFSLYVSYAGSFGRFYGSLASVVVLLTWLFIGALAIMIGAEVNAYLVAEMTGRPRPGLKAALDRRERSRS